MTQGLKPRLRRTARMERAALLPLLLALAFVVAGCIGGNDGPGDGADADAPTSAPPTPEPEPPEEPGDEGPTPGSHAFTDEDSLWDRLLVGYWYANQQDGFTNEGVDHSDHPLTVVAQDANGSPVGATRFTITVEAHPEVGAPGQNYNLYLFSPTGELMAKSGVDDCTPTDQLACVASMTAYEAETIEWETEPVPSGEYVIRVILYFGTGVHNGYNLSWAVDYSYV